MPRINGRQSFVSGQYVTHVSYGTSVYRVTSLASLDAFSTECVRIALDARTDAPVGPVWFSTDNLREVTLTGDNNPSVPSSYARNTDSLEDSDMNDELSTCEMCSGSAPADDMTDVLVRNWRASRGWESQNWCQSCVDNDSVTCAHCGDVASDDSPECEDCGTVCPPCADDSRYCDMCDVSFCDDYGHDHDDDDYDNYDGTSGRTEYFHSCGHKPAPIFHGTGNVHFGFELELVTREYAACDVVAGAMTNRGHDMESHMYAKSDGSVAGIGLECVSHPMSYAYVRDNFDWSWLESLAEDFGAYSDTDNNSFHVHVSRAAFRSQWHVYKFAKFIQANRRALVRACRRESQEWAAFNHRYDLTPLQVAKGRRDNPRYVALNANNSATLEFRAPGSSTNPADLIGTLAFLDALVEMTRDMTNAQVALGGLEWSALVQFMADRPEYAPGYEYLTGLSLVGRQAA